MADTIFRVLAGLEHASLQSEVSEVLGEIIPFIESGVCSDSKVDRFIMENFRLTATKMAEKWNRIYHKNKSGNTFRGQVSLLGSYICSILGYTASEINDAFVTGNMDVLRDIQDIVRVFPCGNMNLADGFIGQDLLPAASLERNYLVKDCQKELHLLQSLDRRIIQSKIDVADAGKLSYVLGVLSQPLVTDIYVKTEGKKKKFKAARVNRDKVQFLKALSPQTSHLTTPISSGIMEVLVHMVQEYEALPKEMKQKIREKSTEQTRKKAERFMRMFTDNASRKYIDNLNTYDLFVALQKYRK